MKRACPCGCGQKIGFLDRQRAKRALVLEEQVEYLSTVTLPAFTEARTFEGATPLRRFIQEGRDYATDLRAEAHGRFSSNFINKGPVDPRAALHWAKAAEKVRAMTLPAVMAAMAQEGEQ